jgi:hypothetical protein
MEKPAFTRANSSDIRFIMVIMHVPMVELLCQAMKGRIPIIKYLISGPRGRLWPHLVVPCIKCYRFLRSRLTWCLPGTGKPLGVTARGISIYQVRLQGGSRVGRQVVKSCLSTTIRMEERTSTDYSYV